MKVFQSSFTLEMQMKQTASYTWSLWVVNMQQFMYTLRHNRYISYDQDHLLSQITEWISVVACSRVTPVLCTQAVIINPVSLLVQVCVGTVQRALLADL